MVIDKITDSRDSHFAIYKQVEASGLAFAELGKVGYKLELTKDIVLDEIKAAQNIHKWDKEYDNPPTLEGNTIVTNINYWLDKVFPNQKDENNNITKWLTPWCYEIRMDWRYYAENRDSSKIYDDAFISNWAIQGVGDKATLVPTEKTEQQEKARLVDCKNSNKYNITQDIAEAFEVFCRYEYKCDQNGKFIKTYTDDEGKVWTGRKVIFYNRAIKQEDPIVVDYQKNLQSIERTSDSSEIYTKLYVTKLEAEEISNGYVTIADTTANPLRDEFILNFDYLDNTGALNDYQRQFIGLYKTGIAEANRKLIPLFEAEEEGVADLVELKAKASFYEHEETAAQEEYQYYKDLYDNFNRLGAVTKDKDNSYSAIFVEETKDSNCYYASLGLYGINAESIKLYPDYKYAKDKILNNADNTKIVYSVPDTLKFEEADNNLYIQLNEYGYPKRLYCHKNSIFNVGTAYLGLEYTPENEYETIYQYFENKILAATKDKAEYENIVAAKVEELKKLEESVQALLKLKDDFNSKLERILGPALREGYWTPDEYEDHASQVIEEFENSSILESFWDTETYSFETDGSYFINGVEGGRKYYPYIKLKESGIDFSKNAPNTLILYENGELQSAPITSEIPAGWKWFQIGDVRYYINLPAQTPPADGEEKKYFIFIKDNDNVSFTLPDKTTYTLADSGMFRTTVPSGDAVPNPIPELRPAFDNINRNWTAHYYGVHFKYGYVNEEPCIILLTEEGNSLNAKSHFSYTFEGDNPAKDVTGGYVCEYDTKYTVQHPRIRIKEKNVQTTSSLFTIVNTKNEKILERYKDYVVIISDSYPIITLKPNEKNSLDDIRDKAYKIGYTSSKANEYMYLDAIQVAKDNSIPRYTYSLQIANLPHDFSHIELGQMLYINDHSLGVHAATGYVNKIEYALDQPQEDGVEIQNYKTKFEDLFSTITAQSEAMKTNRRAYEIAAQAFTSTANGGMMGQISGSVLQSALKNNSYLLNWSATGVEITPDQGIILTNKTPYSNGVTGQVILQGGGIFLSDSVDANGNRIWSQAITPHGINASLINAGQLNTDKILVYAGDNMAFQWNPEGIHAYKIDESGLHKDIYVKYSQHGLHLVNDSLGDWGDNLIDCMKSLVTINWDGLTLKNNSGETTLFADRENGDLTLRGTLKSYDYHEGESRVLSTGWKIDANGYAEFNDLFVRGTISASVFEYEETSAVGGRMLISPTFILKNEHTNLAEIVNYQDDSEIIIKVPIGIAANMTEKTFNAGGRDWKDGQVIIFNGKFINKDALKAVETGKDISSYKICEIKQLHMKLTITSKKEITLTSLAKVDDDRSINVFFDETGTNIKYSDAIKQMLGKAKDDKITAEDLQSITGTGDWHLISFGDSEDGTKEGILLTAIEPNSDAYIDILGKGSDDITGSTRVRLGDLSALTINVELNNLGIKPEGWGLFADNVYLRGLIQAIQGQIGGWTISEGELLSGSGKNAVHLSSVNEYAFWAGGDIPSDASFKVSRTGILKATGAEITGEIIATSLYIGDKDIKNYLNDTLDPLIDKIDGKTTTYYSETEPTNPEINDIWYNTSAGIIWKYNITGWEDITEESLKAALDAADTAQTTADGKIVTYAQPDEPQAAATEGDLWIDTNDNNKLYRWNSTTNKWESVRDEGIQEAQEAANSAIESAEDAYAFAQKINNGEKGIFFHGSDVASVQLNTDVGGLIITGKKGSYFKATNDAFGFFQADGKGLLYAENGSLWLEGYITAKGGTIGGWTIQPEKLTAQDNSLVFKPSDTYNTGDDDNIIENNYVLAIYEKEESKFSINTSGEVVGTEGTFTNLQTNEIFVNGISVMPSVYTDGDEPGTIYAKKGVIWLKKAGTTGGSSSNAAISDKVTYQFISNWGNSGNMIKGNSNGGARTATLSKTTFVKLGKKDIYNYSLEVPIKLKWGKTVSGSTTTYYKGGGYLNVQIQDANGNVLATASKLVRCDHEGGLKQAEAPAASTYRAPFTGTFTENYTDQQNLKVYIYVTSCGNGYGTGNVLSPADGSVFTLTIT